MPNLTFLHFDTAWRSNQSDDPFNCILTLASPIRGIKKIYLKSCEIPIGFFNIRFPYVFSFYMQFPINAYKTQTVAQTPSNSGIYGGVIATPVDGNIQIPIIPPSTGSRNYNWTPSQVNNYLLNGTVPVNGSNNNSNQSLISITVIPGNYTIDTLITYINTAIASIYQQIVNDLHLTDEFNVIPTLTKNTVMDSGAFPVGFVKLNYYPSIIVNGFNANFMTNTVLGFQTSQSDSVNGFIMASSLWGIYNDLAIYLYFPNVPHNNTHFGTLLMSLKSL
jgi:hypothetical protein